MVILRFFFLSRFKLFRGIQQKFWFWHFEKIQYSSSINQNFGLHWNFFLPLHRRENFNFNFASLNYKINVIFKIWTINLSHWVLETIYRNSSIFILKKDSTVKIMLYAPFITYDTILKANLIWRHTLMNFDNLRAQCDKLDNLD